MEMHSQWQPRTRIVVKLRTVDGETLEGFIFAPSDMRVSDVVNSSRPFLPFVGNDGQFSLIAKACLVRVMPDDDARTAQARRIADSNGERPTRGLPDGL